MVLNKPAEPLNSALCLSVSPAEFEGIPVQIGL